ncbi:hypothetical protein M8J76_000998 [Diaphorina citri]|nr:hypothetical protein M8J76_000998 [Diaphorina citri]
MTSSDISTMWKEYCLKSTIVGLRYIVESKRRLYERIGWTLLVVFAAIFVFLMYVSTWYEFVKGPTRIVVDNPRYPLERTDFPAVTICPINKALYNKSVTHTVETLGENSTQEERDQYLKSLFAMSLMRYPYYDQPWKYASSINTSMAQLNKSEISNIMLKLMPTIKEMFEHCWWRGTHFNCEDILRLQRTEEGFCYSFNSKTAERNSMSTINPPFESANGTFKAMRSTAAGKLTGFEFQLKNLEDEYFPMDTRFKGYNIVIHSPENFPDVASNFVMYHDKGKVIRIPLKVATVIGHESLLKLSDEQRDCFFVDEFTYSQSYTSEVPAYFANDAENCYQRCRLKSIETLCNCTPYFFQSSNIRLFSTCGISDLNCLFRLNGKLSACRQHMVHVQETPQTFFPYLPYHSTSSNIFSSTFPSHPPSSFDFRFLPHRPSFHSFISFPFLLEL